MAVSNNCVAVLIFTVILISEIHCRPSPQEVVHYVRRRIPVNTERGVAGLGPDCNTGAIEKTANTASNVVTGAANTAAKGINALTDSGNFLGPVGGAVDTVGTAADNVFDDAVSGVNGAVDAAACGIGDIAHAAVAGVATGNVVGGAEHAVDDFVTGVADIGEDAVGGVGKAVDNVAGDLVNFVDHL